MKIAIDARVIERKMTGIGRYLLDIINNIKKFDKENEYVLFSTVPLKNITDNYFDNIVLNKYKIRDKLYSPFWLNFILKEYLIKNKFDLFFSPNFLCPLGKYINFRRIITVHDVLFKIDKNFFSFYYRNYMNFFLKYSINASDKIITISECSKNDLMNYYKFNENKIKIIYSSADPRFKYRELTELDSIQIREKYKLPLLYVLYVGVIDNRKNISTIIKIADVLKIKKPELKFVLIGKPHYGFGKLINEIRKRENIIYLEYVPDDDLPYIYNLAKLFLFTSYYEGFGIPVLEAMQSGIPVISSNSSSLPEVIGDSGIMHEPDDVDGFANSILFLLENEKLYNEYCNKSIERAKNFNLDNMVLKHLDIFKSI